MTDWLQPLMTFVSATTVALIALVFGAMFVFFSSSAALVLGQFLPFVRRPALALPAIFAATVAVAVGVSLTSGGFSWLPVVEQLLGGFAIWGLIWLREHVRPLFWIIFVVLLINAGLVFLAYLLPELRYQAEFAKQLVLLAVLGFWPLLLAGLIGHGREKRVEWFIALRYLVAKRRQTFISVITVICVMGVALGVAVITVVLSVMNGFSQVWEGKIIGARAHFVLHSRLGEFDEYREVRERLVDIPDVVGATPFVQTDAIMRSESGELQPISLKGIDPEFVQGTTQLAEDMVIGSLENLESDPDGEGPAQLPGVIIGAELADRFFLRVGDSVILISPMGGAKTPLGPAPRMDRFRVAGIFRSNFFLFDEQYVYTNLAAAQKFVRLEDVVSGIEVRTVDAYRSQYVANEAVAAVGELYYARDWKTFYPGFFNALKTERVMMWVLLSFIMVVAGFIIIATLIMMIMEKSRDIAILKTMGCDDDGILRIFASEGFLIGVGGVSLGLGMGLVITWNLDRIQAVVERVVGYDVLPANVYQLQQLPYHIVPNELVTIALIAMVLSIGATLLPCWQAARLDPAEALRYE